MVFLAPSQRYIPTIHLGGGSALFIVYLYVGKSLTRFGQYFSHEWLKHHLDIVFTLILQNGL